METIITTVIIAFIVITAALVGFVAWKSIRKPSFSDKDTKFMIDKWHQILAASQNDTRHAILDADKLLDHALKKKGYEGTLGEKMKAARTLFSDNNGIWEAHKARNKVAHELDFHISPKQCQRHLSQFKKALRDLGLKI